MAMEGFDHQKLSKIVRFPSWILATTVLLLSLLFTAGLWWSARQAAIADLKAEFDFRTSRIEIHLLERMGYYGQVLLGVRSFHESSKKVERQELSRFIAAMKIRHLYSGLRDVGVTTLIPAERAAQHVAEMRRHGLQDYAIKPEGKRPAYGVVVQHELAEELEGRALGYDQFSDPERRAAMEKARDNDAIAMTGKIRLLGQAAAGNQARILMFLPIYQNGKPHETVEERRKNIVGWVFAPLYMDEAMSGMADEITSKLGVEIYDGDEVSENARLFDSTNLPFGAHKNGRLNFRSMRKIELEGRTWSMVFHSIPAFEAHLDTGKSNLILGSGVVLSMLLAMLTWLLGTGRMRALELATRLTANLKESESRFRLMADAAPAKIWMSDASNKRVWVSRGWLDFVGAENPDDFTRIWKACIHPDDAAEYEAIRSAAHEERKGVSSEYRARRHDGQYRWLMSTALPRFNDDGEFLGLIGSAIDITDRKHAEDKLLQAALVYQNSSEAMLVMAVSPDSSRAIVADVNPAFTSLTGYSLGEIVGQPSTIFHSHLYDPAYFAAIRETINRTGSWKGEYHLPCKDGSTRLVWLNISAIFDARGNITGEVTLLRDITAEKEAEKKLKLAALVYQKGNDAMMVFDVDPVKHTSVVADVNPAFITVTGFSADEVIGKSAEYMQMGQHSPEYFEAMRREFFSTGQWQGEFVRRRKNGEKSVTWLSLYGIYDGNGVMTRYVSLARDITRQKEAMETIRALTASLITAKEDEARRIAREIHDDLGQNLSLLRINLALLPRLVSNRPEQVGDSIERMKDWVDRILGTVRNISTNLRPATLDMGLVMAICWQIENFRSHTNIECRLDNRLGDDFNLPDDRSTGVFRILQEALTNVARHAHASSVNVTLRRQGADMIMEIEDNGKGIDADDQRRARSSGLVGMRQRTTMLGGKIEFSSKAGRGTMVTLAIPLNMTINCD